MTLAPAETAARLANVAHVLREAVHRTAGRLPLEPRFEVKALLAAHLYDDARAIPELRRRIEDLGGAVRGPGEELSRLLDRDVYAALKPALVTTLDAHRRQLDPLADEPTLHLVTQLVHRQRRHLAELPTEPEPDLPEDLGALPGDADHARQLTVMDPLERPARDGFVQVVEHAADQHPAHALMDARLCAAELLARTSHEHPDMPDEFHLDLARAARDAARHAELLDRHMSTELGIHWGAFPITLASFCEVYARDLEGRLSALDDTHSDYAPGTPAFDHLRADDAARTRVTQRWRSS
ncbi:MAG: DUF455 family protein [Solirubrobacteraceae bacterium]